MKKRILALAPVIAGALVLTTALPAEAAVTYSTTAIPVAGLAPSYFGSTRLGVDTTTGLVYAASVGTATGDIGEYQIPTVTVVNPSTKTTKVIPLDDGSDYDEAPILDLKVRSASHRIWVLTGSWQANDWLYEIDGTTNKVLRRWTAPQFGSLAIEDGADLAYVSGASFYNENETSPDDTKWFCELQGAGSLVSFDGTTGATASTVLPSPKTLPGVFCEAPKYNDFYTNAIAFDRKNYSLQVAGTGKLWAYTNKLRLAHTLNLADAVDSTLAVGADGTTNTVYLTNMANTTLTVVDGATGLVRTKRTYGRSGTPVVDPSISTLYLGSAVIDAKTLSRTGTAPYAVGAVNGTTHTLYSTDASNVYVTTRKS